MAGIELNLLSGELALMSNFDVALAGWPIALMLFSDVLDS